MNVNRSLSALKEFEKTMGRVKSDEIVAGILDSFLASAITPRRSTVSHGCGGVDFRAVAMIAGAWSKNPAALPDYRKGGR